MKTDILGMKIDTYTFNEAVEIAFGFLSDGEKHTIYTPNPEFVLKGRKDSEFLDIINNGSLVIPDGIGVVYASKLNKVKIKQRVPGYDVCEALFDRIAKSGHSVYFFGSAPGVAEEAKANVEKKFPGINIIGVSDGYIDAEKEKLVITDIMDKKPDILLVGRGIGKQERWICDNMKNLPPSIFIGVGGTIDGLAGRVPRAPKIFQKMNLEWLYRLIKQPERIARQKFIPVFVFTVIFDKLFTKVRSK